MQAQIAQRAIEPTQRREALERLAAGAQRSARLTEQLLDLARLEAGERTARLTSVDLHELIVVTLRDFEVTAHQKRQAIALDGQPCPIVGDTDELGILIRNLIDNAVRYTETGGRIHIGCRRIAHESRPMVRFSISDDGPGVPASERERIFERFFRGAEQCERGSGIGLSLVARIAEMHGASIDVGPGIDGEGLGIAISFVDGGASPRANEEACRVVRTTLR